MLACVAISTSFIISNSYILCLLISSDGLASLTCLSLFFFFLFLGGEILPSSPVLISWAGMHHCTASASYFFQLSERSSGGRAGSKCEGENLATFTCRLEPAASNPCLQIQSSLSEFICLSVCSVFWAGLLFCVSSLSFTLCVSGFARLLHDAVPVLTHIMEQLTWWQEGIKPTRLLVITDVCKQRYIWIKRE